MSESIRAVLRADNGALLYKGVFLKLRACPHVKETIVTAEGGEWVVTHVEHRASAAHDDVIEPYVILDVAAV